MVAKRQALKNVKNASWLFGHPVARADNASFATWVYRGTSPQYQKGGGWLVALYGGVQSGDDWCACYIPVNEYPVTLFDDAQWSYWMTNAERIGVNIVIWVHDANDFDKRAEITQLGSHDDLEKAAGWNAHEFTASTGGMFFYGENTAGTLLTAGTQYTWSQFQADQLFKDWVIYRVSLEYGWDTTGTADLAYLAEVKLNGIPVPLVPPQSTRKDTKSIYKATVTDSTTRVTLLTGTVGMRVRVHNVFMATASATAANFEMYFGTGANITTDTTKGIAFMNLDTDTVASVSIPYGDDGPLGAVSEVVSMRTSANITSNGTFVLVYSEE